MMERKWVTHATVIAAVAIALVMLFSVMLPIVGGGASASSGTTSVGSTAIASTADATAVTSPSSASPASATDTSCPNASPHCGTMYVYEVAPGGAQTEDPNVLYDTVSEEPAMNVFQTLITYAGNTVSSYVPEAATCVPGTSACTSLYGSDLIVDNTTTGAPEYYTFVIGPSHFYNPATGASWQMYPSDVLFSVARSLTFFQYLGVGSTGGGDIGQTLLNPGNPSFDSGLHYPFNNTPQQILLNAMYVNDTAYCPSSAMTGNSFGCITFNVWGGGQSWPFFMEAMTQIFSSAAVMPCGWYTAQGAGLPGFTVSAPNGDGPCQFGGSTITSTTSSSFVSAVNRMGPTAWDSISELMKNYPAPDPQVRFNIVGSGPYYLSYELPSVGYQLRTNPAYVQPNCAGLAGCQPAPDSYASHVLVYWEATDTQGIQEFAAGQADFAGISTTDTPTLLALTAQGKIDYTSFDTLSIFFWTFTLNFSATSMNTILPSGDTFNIPQTFFANMATRQLLVGSWPYEAYQNTINTVDGVVYGNQYGGVIPNGMGDYVPTNITWPYNNPADSPQNFTNPNIVGSAAWWWTEGTTVGSPYYNATLAACKTTACVFPIFGQQGDPGLDEGIALWISQIEAATNHRLLPYDVDLPFVTEVGYSTASPPGQNPMDFYTLGWIPDYPDPSNNIAAMAAANGTYTTSSSLWQTFNTPYYMSSTCPAVGQAYTTWKALAYWAAQAYPPNGTGIAGDCQGWAYDTMSYWMSGPTLHEGNITLRILEYNMEEHILSGLALNVYFDQSLQLYSASTWVNLNSVNTNVMVGGGGDQYWYAITFLPKAYTMSFTQSGLPSGTSWSVVAAGQTYTTTSSTVSLSMVPGTYNYTVLLVPGYKVTTAISGQVTLSTKSVNTPIGFAATTTKAYPVTIVQSGVIWGTPSSVLISSAGGVPVSGGSTTFMLPTGTYDYTVVPPAAYTSVTPLTGSFTVGSTSSPTLSLVFKGVKFSPVPLTIGLSGSSAVSAGFNAQVKGFGSQAYPNGTAGTNMTFWEPADSSVTFSAMAGATLGPSSFEYGMVTGTISVGSGPTFANITFPTALPTVSTTFTATGLPAGTMWYLSINGANVTMTNASATFALPAGTYSFSAYAAGYVATPSGGTVSVVGTPQTYSVSFAKPSVTTTTTGLSTLAYALIGVLAAVAVIFIALAAYFASRGRKPSSPAAPQSWDAPKGGSGGAGGSGGSGGSS